MKRALIVGNDKYSAAPLYGCVKDATRLAARLEDNGDGSPNFDVRLFLNTESSELDSALRDLFASEADTALFYFSGHGLLDGDTNSGYLVATDGRSPNWGISLSTILSLANESAPERIKSVVIILDCCHSGKIGAISEIPESKGSFIGSGVTIMTASGENEYALEGEQGGVFTNLLIDALGGSAADILGRVTPAALYTHVDQTLGAWEQRPVYKANVKQFITLRTVPPRVARETLRSLPEWFPNESDMYKLEPSYEPDRGEEAERLANIPVNQENVRIYRQLQKLAREGLVRPAEYDHMWHAAVFSTGCYLTATGAHYRRLAEGRKI